MQSFSRNEKKPHMHINHEEYYHDRLTESDLCYDFPGDEILIDGLHAMQLHLWSNNVQVDIPVVRVMNAAHFLAAYMFATTCSGDRMEYDTLAYSSVGHDQRLVLVTMVVLAAMLSRTEGFRARNCRNLIISDRGVDFEEGLTLYERFLRSAEQRFAEEDFLIDTHTQIQRLTAENERLTSENIQLKYTLTNMENQQNIQYKQDNNQGTIYNAPVYITYAAPQQAASEPVSTAESKQEPNTSFFKFFTQKCFEEKRAEAVEAEIRAACKGTAEALWRTLWNNENLGYVETQHIDATTLYREIENHYGKLPYSERNFRKARNNR